MSYLIKKTARLGPRACVAALSYSSHNTCLLASILDGGTKRFSHKVYIFMMAEMHLDTRDTYPTKSDHIIIMMYLYVYGCVFI